MAGARMHSRPNEEPPRSFVVRDPTSPETTPRFKGEKHRLNGQDGQDQRFMLGKAGEIMGFRPRSVLRVLHEPPPPFRSPTS